MKEITVFLAASAFALPAALFAAKPGKPARTKPDSTATQDAQPGNAKDQAFAKYDANKNGKLDADEAEAVRKDFAASPKGALKRLDADKDGKLSDTEITALQPGAKRAGGKRRQAAAVAKPAEAVDPTAQLAAKYDANQNGRLDPQEYDAVRKEFSAEPKGALAKIDTDGDGKLSDEELAAAKPAMAKPDDQAATPPKKKKKAK